MDLNNSIGEKINHVYSNIMNKQYDDLFELIKLKEKHLHEYKEIDTQYLILLSHLNNLNEVYNKKEEMIKEAEELINQKKSLINEINNLKHERQNLESDIIYLKHMTNKEYNE